MYFFLKIFVIFFNGMDYFSRICVVNLIPYFSNFNSVNVVYFELFLLRLAYGWPKSDVAGGFLNVADVAGERMAGLWLAYYPLRML